MNDGRDEELERARQREAAALRALSEIGASASVLAHEVKNPITGIEAALRAVGDQLGLDHKEVLEDLAGRLHGLEARIRRALAFARPLDPRPHPCGPRELLEAAASAMAGRSGAEIVIDVPADCPNVLADPALLADALSEGILNAVEAGLPGASAGGATSRHVRLSARADGPDGVLLCIEDDGPGIPPTQREHAWKAFVTTRAERHGMGLTVCRRILEELGGSAEIAESGLGGVALRLRLPRAS